MTLTVEELERVAAEVESEINTTRAQFNELERSHPGWGIHGEHTAVAAALGRAHAAQMDAHRLLQSEIERRASEAQQEALVALLGDIGCRLPDHEND